jgi:hypothetical protein
MWKDIKVCGRKLSWCVQSVDRFGFGGLRVYDEMRNRYSRVHKKVNGGYSKVLVKEDISQREVYKILCKKSTTLYSDNGF